MLAPRPTQYSGAKFLAERKVALLADEPRVGKTGAAIIAADYIFASKILVITTSSGRPVWRRGFRDWSAFPRKVRVLEQPPALSDPLDGTTIVGWGGIAIPKMHAALSRHEWDLIISDEDHYAKSFEAKRTQALYGVLDGDELRTHGAIGAKAKAVWPLTGTPMPNSLLDMYARLRALAPERLAANPARGWPDVTRLTDYKKRYCIIRRKKTGYRWIEIVVGGRNPDELNARLEGFMLLRTQADVGIEAPIYETFPLTVSDAVRKRIDGSFDHARILAAADTDDTDDLELHFGPLRRLTGDIKAHAIVEAIKEDFACGLDKVVLMRWHHETGRILREGLAEYGVVTVDGTTSARDRESAEKQFRENPEVRVFDGQIQAAGEAIDLSAAALLVFVETSSVPKDMKQAALRITNLTQTRQCFVRVAVLEGSIDEALQTLLLRKWAPIREALAQ